MGVNAWAWLLEHSPIEKLPQGTRKLSSEIVEIKFTCSVGYRQFSQGFICTAWKNQRHVCTVNSHTASAVAACYMNVYCTRFVSTNESRAVFVWTNPIEVPWRKKKRKRKKKEEKCGPLLTGRLDGARQKKT